MHITPCFNSLVLLFRNEEKLVALLIHSSFKRVVTSGFRINFVASRSSSRNKQAVLKWGMNMESLRIQQIIAARHSYYNGSDVTRLVATRKKTRTEKKHSFRESITLQFSQATCTLSLVKSTVLNCTYCNKSSHLHWKGGFIFND